MITIKHLKDKDGDFLNSYLGDNGRYYTLTEMYDEDGNKLFDFTVIDMTDLEVADIAVKAADKEAEYNLERLRTKRDQLLVETDYWALSDMPSMTTEQINYRQALRDITDNYSSLDTVVWPTKP